MHPPTYVLTWCVYILSLNAVFQCGIKSLSVRHILLMQDASLA